MNNPNDQIKEEKAVSKTTKKTTKKPEKKTTKKATKKATKKSKKTTKKESTNSPFQLLSKKTSKLFDSIIDEVKELPKKTSKLSKNTQVIDKLTTLINKTKTQILNTTEEITEKHSLNSKISSLKRKLVQKHLQLGKETYSLIESDSLTKNALKEIYEEINSIKQEIKKTEATLKKLFDKKT